MSLKTLPLLFINLGGEMMYILDQRLRAQNIPAEKARKVLHDIVGTMYNRRFMEELFKPQDLYSKKAMRTVFDRLAHASIMRLNAASMDKLYDLMTMAFKYQVSLCVRPADILLITLNHLDAVHHFVDDSQPIRQQVQHVYRLLIETFGSMSNGEYNLIRQTLLSFFQDMHIRVSIFLKDKVQTSNGRFTLATSGQVAPGTEVPGLIRIFNSEGTQVRTAEFYPGGKYIGCPKVCSFDLKGDRCTKLGTNMYNSGRSVDTSLTGANKTVLQSADVESASPNPLATAQLDLLSTLIGGSVVSKRPEFKLSLFTTDDEEEQASSFSVAQRQEENVIRIDAKKQSNDELMRIMGELNVQPDDATSNSADDDLLDLLDSA